MYKRQESLSTQNRDKNWQVTAFANRVYTEVLGRPGEPEGLNSWTGGLLNGVTAATMVHNTYFSPEYLAKNTSDAEFVESMYRCV